LIISFYFIENDEKFYPESEVNMKFYSGFRLFQKLSRGQSENTAKHAWLSVGLKMMISVGLVSNLCIGVLIYVNFKASSQVAVETNALFEVNASMNENLRSKIFELQKKYLEIPKLLQIDVQEQILDWIKDRYHVEKEEMVKGRENYGKFFTRSGRRDISKGGFAVQDKDGILTFSKGILDETGQFSDSVLRIRLKSENPESDARKIKEYIDTASQATGNEDAVKQKIIALKNILADESIKAETSRNEILYRVEDFQKKKSDLVQYRKEKQDMINLMAILAIFINFVMLNFVAWLIIETPLKKLTMAIERVNKGEFITMPFQNRRDRIGVLAGSLKNFQKALTNLRKEDQRKIKEKQIIQELIQDMSSLIKGLQLKANAMKENAVELNGLASNTEIQTTNATESVSRTVKQTDMVSYSTQQLTSAVKDISQQVSHQNELVGDINDVILASMSDINELTQASKEINEIVHIVKNIAGETKLLALNARIEAARAGMAGKGFSVVAGEVRELSTQTETANEDIEKKIKSIQDIGTAIISNTRMIEQRIEKLMEASHQIAASVEEQSMVTTGIAKNAQATTSDINDVSQRISKVKETAAITTGFAQDVQSNSEEIAAELLSLLTKTSEKLSSVGFLKGSEKKAEPEEHVSVQALQESTDSMNSQTTNNFLTQ